MNDSPIVNRQSSIINPLTLTGRSPVEPRVVTHIEAASRGGTHYHGALYSHATRQVIERCPHNHRDLTTALDCAREMALEANGVQPVLFSREPPGTH